MFNSENETEISRFNDEQYLIGLYSDINCENIHSNGFNIYEKKMVHYSIIKDRDRYKEFMLGVKAI